jgi:hypothetical protein
MFMQLPGNVWDGGERVVLLIDGFSALFKADDATRDDFLGALRHLRHLPANCVLSSVIATGTFDIVHITTTDRYLSPFNVSNVFKSPNFSKEETGILFACDRKIMIDDDVVLVLLKSDVVTSYYRMASPLIDALIRMRVIPTQFQDALATIPPSPK